MKKISPEQASKIMKEESQIGDEFLKICDKYFNDPTNDTQFEQAREKYAKKNGINSNMDEGARKKVVAVGLGPGGATTVLEAFYAGAQVTAVEKREGYTRPNNFRFTRDAMNHIAQLFGYDTLEDAKRRMPADHPLKYLIDQGLVYEMSQAAGVDVFTWGERYYTIQTKTLEILLSKLVEKQAALHPEQMKVMRGYGYEGIDDQGQVKLRKDGKETRLEKPDVVTEALGPVGEGVKKSLGDQAPKVVTSRIHNTMVRRPFILQMSSKKISH